jgi:hypothetical protein
MAFSGAKTKRAALCWALEEALRHRAADDLLSDALKIDFATTPDQLEAREIEAQYGRRRQPRRR